MTVNKFDKVVDRRGSKAEKWDGMNKKFGREDLLPLWIADMDFEVAEAISDAVEKRAAHHVYGYGICDDNYYNAVIDWMKKRHDWEIEKEWIVYTNGVISGISFILDAITEKGDKVMIQTPVYDPFYSVVEDNNCEVVENPLIYKDRRYYIDFEDMEAKMKEGVDVLLLCSPHNPVGRVWTKEELENIVALAKENDVIIISDEIHSEIVFEGVEHIPLHKIDKDYMDKMIICTSPTKAFNIAGLQVSNMIIKNRELREKLNFVIGKYHFVRPSIFGVEAMTAAYTKSEEWLDGATKYIEDNKKFVEEYLERNIPKLKVVKGDGTYLLWLDFTDFGMTNEDLVKALQEDGKLGLINGKVFGQAGSQHQRMNIACRRGIIEEALERMKKVFMDK